jgi:hypothetical protein
LSILPLLTGALLYRVFQRCGFGRRRSILLAATVWAVVLTAITEMLSLGRLLTSDWVAFCWFGVAAGLALWDVALFVFSKKRELAEPAEHWGPWVAPIAAIGAILGVTGLVALVAPPNNYDSLTYHLPRVVHWIQNGSVCHYPTHIIRQLYQNPWAEFAILHLQLLSGRDAYANLVQWFSLAGTILGVSLLAQQLGAERRGEVSTAVVCATIPMAILQASTTQNDLVVAFWLVCFICFGLAMVEKGSKHRWIYTAATGLSLGLAILTKATAYIFALPFCLWIGWRVLRAHGTAGMAAGVLLTVLAVALNIGHYARNVQMFGSPLGVMCESPDGTRKYTNDAYGARALASSMLRNAALELTLPGGRFNAGVEAGSRRLHSWIGADVDDPRTTFTGTQFRLSGEGWNSEDRAASTLHFLLALAAATVILVWRQPYGRVQKAYVLAVLAAAVLFCWQLRWQEWHCRLHLVLLVLASVPIGLVLERQMRAFSRAAILAVLCTLAFPFLIYHKLHPITGEWSIFTANRTAQYFASIPGSGDAYQSLTDEVFNRRLSKVGLELGYDDVEYPFWVLLRQQNPRIRIEHVGVTNASAVSSLDTFHPDVIFTTDHAKARLNMRFAN